MGTDLFRKSALQTLSSPEQLDQAMKIANPRAWIALCAVGLVLGAGVLWSVFGSLPISVSGAGIIIRTGGISNMVASGNGVIAEFAHLQPGAMVRKGQVLARIAQPSLALQVESAKGDVERLQLEAMNIRTAIDTEQQALAKFTQSQKAQQDKVIQARRVQWAALKKIEQRQEELLGDGLITEQRYEESRIATLSAQNELGRAQGAFQQLSVDALDQAERRNERLRQLRSRIEEADGKFQALQLRHQLESTIVSELDGAVVERMASQGDNVRSGQPVLSVEIDKKALEVMIFLPPQGNAKRITPGMAAQISPADAKKERFGYMVGTVVSVSKYPATEQGMMAVFNNANLVRELSKTGPPHAVLVQFVADAKSASGYHWSTGAGSKLPVTSGTMATGTFIVEQNRPISLLIPLLKQSAGL